MRGAIATIQHQNFTILPIEPHRAFLAHIFTAVAPQNTTKTPIARGRSTGTQINSAVLAPRVPLAHTEVRVIGRVDAHVLTAWGVDTSVDELAVVAVVTERTVAGVVRDDVEACSPVLTRVRCTVVDGSLAHLPFEPTGTRAHEAVLGGQTGAQVNAGVHSLAAEDVLRAVGSVESKRAVAGGRVLILARGHVSDRVVRATSASVEASKARTRIHHLFLAQLASCVRRTHASEVAIVGNTGSPVQTRVLNILAVVERYGAILACPI